MGLDRRQFLFGSTALLASAMAHQTSALELNSIKILAPSVNDGIPIIQGYTDKTSARLLLLVPKEIETGIEIKTSFGLVIPFVVLREEARSYAKYKVLKIKIDGLVLGIDYTLTVFEKASGQVIDLRTFRAFDTSQTKYRLMLASCMNDNYLDDAYEMWKDIPQLKHDLIILNGDTVYADNADGSRFDHSGGWENFWQRYENTAARLGLYRWKHLTPVIATWDDHDFGANGGNIDFVEKHITTYLFHLFFQWREDLFSGPQIEWGPGVASRLKTDILDIALLDDRSFRDIMPGQQIGQEQTDWLFNQLSNESTFLVSGNVFFGAYWGGESFEGSHPNEFKNILTELGRRPGKVVFGSGDVHFSEVMKIEKALMGYETIEITSSSIHSHTFPGWHNQKRNPRRITATSAKNFVTIDLEKSSQGLDVSIRSFAKGLVEKFNHRTSIVR
jgi:alkaline phosphatase D